MTATTSRPQSVGELLSSARGPLFSFEFYPPRSEEEEPVLWRAVESLAPHAPDFVSVTYGATGSRRDRTIHATRRIAVEGGLLTVGHLTCVDQSKAEIAEANKIDETTLDSALAKSEKLTTNTERRLYLTSCWLETLLTAEARVLGWAYQEMYGRPFTPAT